MLFRIILSTFLLISVSLYTTHLGNMSLFSAIADTNNDNLIKYVGTCTTKVEDSPVVESLCAIEIAFYYSDQSKSYELLTYVSPYSPDMGGNYLVEWYSKSSSLVSISDTTQLVPRTIVFKSHKPSRTCHTLNLDNITTFCFTGGHSK